LTVLGRSARIHGAARRQVEMFLHAARERALSPSLSEFRIL